MTDAPASLAGSPAGPRILPVENDDVVATESARRLRVAGAAILDIKLDVGRGAGDGSTVCSPANRPDALGIPSLFVTGDIRVARLPAYSAKRRLEMPL